MYQDLQNQLEQDSYHPHPMHLHIEQHLYYDINQCELFYVPKGTTIELYATTLHYTPITVKNRFKTICLLLKGTGESCERIGILKKCNKWFIAHRENIEKVSQHDLYI